MELHANIADNVEYSDFLNVTIYGKTVRLIVRNAGKWDKARCTNCGHMDVEEPDFCSRCGSYNGGEE